jgi:hypothetical protein
MMYVTAAHGAWVQEQTHIMLCCIRRISTTFVLPTKLPDSPTHPQQMF